MTTKVQKSQIAESLRNLVAAYSKALAHLEDALAVLCKELELGEIEIFQRRLVTLQDATHDPEDAARPITDQLLLSIRWRGKSCFLGNTLPFWFFERLARRPNQYYSYEQLLEDVWEGPRTFAAVRSVAKVLRRKLVEAGMDDLAKAIDGSVSGHYGLMLDKSK